jgi:hypothetical protein
MKWCNPGTDGFTRRKKMIATDGFTRRKKMELTDGFTRRAAMAAALLLLLFPVYNIAQQDYRVVSDVVYGHKAGMALTYDVISPADSANGAGIIHVVSGSWNSRYNPRIRSWSITNRSWMKALLFLCCAMAATRSFPFRKSLTM